MKDLPPSSKDAARQAREKRLAEALRANLKRRKAAGKDTMGKAPAPQKAPGPRS